MQFTVSPAITFPVMVSITYTLAGSQVLVPGTVNGKPVSLLLDTRSSGLVLSPADTARCGNGPVTLGLDILGWDDVPAARGGGMQSLLGLSFLLASCDQVAFQVPTSQLTLYHSGGPPGRILP